MKLKKIEVKNYKSIQALTFEISAVADSFTYTLLGINESGKTSFLKAVSLLDDKKISYPLDYYDESVPVEISLLYELELADIKDIKDVLKEHYAFDKNILHEIEIPEVIIKVSYAPNTTTAKTWEEILKFRKSIFDDYTTDADGNNKLRKKLKSEEESKSLDLKDFFENEFQDYFWDKSHKVTLWASTPEYLILDEIDLDTFSADPTKVSVPLANCFKIANKNDIKVEIAKLNSPVSIQNLEDLLSDKVTEHINQVWPEHPIRIRFKINERKLTFLVEDKDVKYKIKTTGQRSDGFRQFISFLLTVSAENYTEELSNSILLLDEPETHLHPTAQMNLCNELIKISNNKNNNIVFFATHSNYMIDKVNIDRCYKVSKKKNSTSFEQIKNTSTSYSEVNFEVFDIATNDYHNELYGYLEDVSKSKLNTLDKTKKWHNEKTGKDEDVSLATYIRHSIHHPENTSNKKFTENELRKSIQILRQLKYE